MLKFLEHRIADGRILRLISKWLTAGVVVMAGYLQVRRHRRSLFRSW
jgi:hypothetical protein